MRIFKKLFGQSNISSENSNKRKFDLEELLKSENKNNSVIELDNYIGELCSYGEELDKLSEQQKQFYFNQCLEREVNNGGFNQYFSNSSGDYAHLTVQSLKTIGANKTAKILKEAIDQFPDQAVPKERTKRQQVLETIEDKANPFWDKLDQKFYKYEDDLNKLNMEFVKNNKENFE